MIRARVWLRCAALGDQVQPTLVAPAKIGWKGKSRVVDLALERPFTGEELLQRMKGWVTVEPRELLNEVRGKGRFKIFDDGGLVLEVENEAEYQALCKGLKESFGEGVELEPFKD